MSGHSSVAPLVVVGAVHREYVLTVPTAPAPGETVLANGMRQHPGGGGVRQAVAASRVLGGGVVLLGCVGDDASGELLLQELRAEGVDTSEIEIVGWMATGVVVVQAVAGGGNATTVVPGANSEVPAARVGSALGRRCDAASVVVVQADLRAEVVSEALRAAVAVGARCVLDLGSRLQLDPDELACGDPLVVDEGGAASVLGRPVSGVVQAMDAARELQRFARSSVVSVQGYGACWAGGDGEGRVPVTGEPSTRTGAGTGALAGVLAARLAGGASLGSAVQDGVRADVLPSGSTEEQSPVPWRSRRGMTRPEG
ncbi:PfkB family carbohydrate kinase [Kineococcus sp. TBRC 1896]|uniref:PfkB family carbohydrate kinase n=1 Tax=Kineococcus mangrovi TaxID=1660183 RepID=A0ABV4IA74_9ACTN